MLGLVSRAGQLGQVPVQDGPDGVRTQAVGVECRAEGESVEYCGEMLRRHRIVHAQTVQQAPGDVPQPVVEFGGDLTQGGVGAGTPPCITSWPPTSE